MVGNEAENVGADIFVKMNIKSVIKNKKEDIIGVSGTGPNGETIFHSKVVMTLVVSHQQFVRQ